MMRSHCPSHIDNGPFTRRVEEIRRPAFQTSYAAYIDDDAFVLLALIFHHGRNGISSHLDHARNVNLKSSRPLLHIDIESRAAGTRHADIVDENVETAERVQRKSNDSCAVICKGDVPASDNGLPTTGLRVGHLAGPLGPGWLAVDAENMAAFVCEHDGHRTPVADALSCAPRARDDGNFAS